jgi:hypothetical protein
VWFFEWPWHSGQNGFSTELTKFTKLGGTKPDHPKQHFFLLSNPDYGILLILPKTHPSAFSQKPALYHPRPPLAIATLFSEKNAFNAILEPCFLSRFPKKSATPKIRF